MLTKYETMPTQDLLRQLEDKREFSPIIDELCNRLEKPYKEICPVCEANLEEAGKELT